jgi:hypothetical protein
MERCNECKMCDAIIGIERRVVALEEATKENQGCQASLRTTTQGQNAQSDTARVS